MDSRPWLTTVGKNRIALRSSPRDQLVFLDIAWQGLQFDFIEQDVRNLAVVTAVISSSTMKPSTLMLSRIEKQPVKVNVEIQC